VALNNSILVGNTNDDCASCAIAPSTAFSFTNNDSYIGGISGATAPTLGPLQWNGGPTQTMMPLPGSSAICAGSTTFISTTFRDQRDFSLPSGDCSTHTLDQGAVQSMYLTVNSTADTAPGSYTVKCGVKEGKAGKEGLKAGESALATAVFTVKAFEPPAIRCPAMRSRRNQIEDVSAAVDAPCQVGGQAGFPGSVCQADEAGLKRPGVYHGRKTPVGGNLT